jgi:hypothetical protein
MEEQIQTRLQALKLELEKGQLELQKVETQRTYLQEMVLRISGAIQVLEDLAGSYSAKQDGASPTQMGSAFEQTATGSGAS